MYAPLHNQVADRAAQVAFMREYNFAVLITSAGRGALDATHLPVLVEDASPIRLVAHLARANPQAAAVAATAEAGGEALMIFSGPHAYVSPSWYERQPSVPTWNYQAVHAYGRVRATNSAEKKIEALRKLIDAHEPGYRPVFEELPHHYLSLKLDGIFAFEMDVQRIEARFKLSQDRSTREQANIVDRLKEQGAAEGLRLAVAMQQQQKGPA